jgi:hypothetical protein
METLKHGAVDCPFIERMDSLYEMVHDTHTTVAVLATKQDALIATVGNLNHWVNGNALEGAKSRLERHERLMRWVIGVLTSALIISISAFVAHII